MKSYFYPQSIYTSVLAFADLFNDMTVRVYSKTGEIIGVKPVPATLTPREKIVSILKAGGVNDVDPQIDNYLPRISINMNGMQWDSERMRGKFEKRLINIEYDDNGQKRTMQIDLQPVPYNLTFDVAVWAKYYTDGAQLIENILPWFAPEVHVSFKERNFGIEHKSKVVLESVNQNHVYEFGESGETGRRVLQWTLTFNMETVLWKPMQLTPEIVCSIISINNVPCKKLPFAGSKIIVTEEESNQPESLFSKQTNIAVFDLDASEQYDDMVKYWKNANRTMNAPSFVSCVDNDCNSNPGPKPEWDPTLNVTPCHPVIKKPILIIDPLTECIINYWQEMLIVDSIIHIVSYKRVYSAKGESLSDPIVISNDDYPTDTVVVSNINSSLTVVISAGGVGNVPVTLEDCSGAL